VSSIPPSANSFFVTFVKTATAKYQQDKMILCTLSIEKKLTFNKETMLSEVHFSPKEERTLAVYKSSYMDNNIHELYRIIKTEKCSGTQLILSNINITHTLTNIQKRA